MVVDTILVFAALIAILLVAAYISEKLGIGIGKGGGLPPPPPQPQYSREGYNNIRQVLYECIKENHAAIGVCPPSEHLAQYSGEGGRWYTIENCRVIYWYVLNVYPNSDMGVYANINLRKLASALNTLLPSFCDYAGVERIRVVKMRNLPFNRVEIGVTAA